MTTRRPAAGRPEATSHAAIEQAAFELFAERGFEGTTLDHIATAVGVTRRTLFRYYASKNDIPWGQFDLTLVGFRALLDTQPTHVPLREAVGRAVVAFNDFSADSRPPHATRMRLILQTPALQAHSALKYAQWREVIAEYVAERLGQSPHDLTPQLVGHVALAHSITAYEQWLRAGGEEADALLMMIRESITAMDDLYDNRQP